MRIFLYASTTTEGVRQDAEILAVRGYDVLTMGDVIESMGNVPVREYMRTTFRCVAGVGDYQERVLVLHPNTVPDAIVDLKGFGKTVDVLVVHMQDLPGLAPEQESALIEFDIRMGRFSGPVLEITEARSLRDRLRAVYRTLTRWESRANEWLGVWMKNPVVRELQKQPVNYRLNTRTTTTG
jgi:hypothetical protein